MATATSEKKYQVWTTGRMRWVPESEMTLADWNDYETRQKAKQGGGEAQITRFDPIPPGGVVEEPTATVADTTTYPDYTRLITDLQREVELAERERREARTDAMKTLADNRIAELKRGIENAQAASSIPAVRTDNGYQALTAVQFGATHARNIVRVPPGNLDDFAGVFPLVRFENYRTIVADPLAIACLRRECAQHPDQMREVALGWMYALPPDLTGEGMWVSPEQYDEMTRKGLAK